MACGSVFTWAAACGDGLPALAAERGGVADEPLLAAGLGIDKSFGEAAPAAAHLLRK